MTRVGEWLRCRLGRGQDRIARPAAVAEVIELERPVDQLLLAMVDRLRDQVLAGDIAAAAIVICPLGGAPPTTAWRCTSPDRTAALIGAAQVLTARMCKASIE